jgi:hypothetical protein
MAGHSMTLAQYWGSMFAMTVPFLSLQQAIGLTVATESTSGAPFFL